MAYTIPQLQQSVAASECWTDVCRALNITICTFNFKKAQRLCQQYNISISHFNVKRTFRRNKFEWSEENIFCENSRVPRCSLRRICARYGVYTGVCAECGIPAVWNGKPLTIELDHINGINDDNRKENLRWLCPNCHSQTPTHKNSANRRKGEM